MNIDLKNISSNAEKMIDYSNQLSEEFELMFSRLESINIDDAAWVGPAATKFVDIVKTEKAKYFALQSELHNMGTVLNNYYEDLESTINIVKGDING